MLFLKRKNGLTLLGMLSVFATSISSVSLAGSTFKTLVKNQEPPCSFVPNMDFMAEKSEAFLQSNMASAAWFARSVQLVDGLRQQAWEQLPVPPTRVQDFFIKKFGLHATLLEFSDTALLMYRGTEDVLDYVLNGTFYTTQGEKHGLPGWVHEGFLINLNLSWPQVSAALKDVSSRGKRIVFSAHSLGGVLSQYAAWLLEKDGIQVHRIYAFQSPNPGDLTFKQEFEDRFSGRASNSLYGEDVTPHIPPILESVEAFASALPKVLAGPASSLVSKARYGALSNRFKISPEGVQQSIPVEGIAEVEVQYWGDYLKKSGGKPFPLGLGAQSPFVADHDIDKVLCSLVKGLN